MKGSVLVAGGGIAGMPASAELLQQRFKVYLVEEGPGQTAGERPNSTWGRPAPLPLDPQDAEDERFCSVHEASVMQSLLDQVTRVVPDKAVLTAVHIDVGQMEHLDCEAMRMLWESMTQEHEFSGARLEIARIPVRIRCRACSYEYEPDDLSLLFCPKCEAARPELIRGSGVLLRTIEVEQGG